jgi:3'-5' exoribonuclease
MARLPPISRLDATASGTGFFLCARKDRRTGRAGPFLILLLQDVTGEIDGKVFQDVEIADAQFEVGEFVAVQGKGNLFNQRLELVVDKIRRVIPDDARVGFREEDCIPTSPRPLEEMWDELQAQIASVQSPHIRELLVRVVAKHGDKLRTWPAARQVHHAYRSGLLEHLLKIMEVATFIAGAYGANRDLLVAGALLHDIGKLEELTYNIATDYSVEGNLVGHIVIGVGMVRDVAAGIEGFPAELLLQIEHLILSHHGAKELGSPVEPMMIEAFILAAVDDLDATLHQVRRHIAADDSDKPFTAFNRRLDRALFKPRPS